MNVEGSAEELLNSLDEESQETEKSDETVPEATPAPSQSANEGEGFIALSEYNLLKEKYDLLQAKYEKLEGQHHRAENVPEDSFHIVKSGEQKAIRVICEKYGTTLSKVERLNHPANLRHLVPGQKVRIK